MMMFMGAGVFIAIALAVLVAGGLIVGAALGTPLLKAGQSPLLDAPKETTREQPPAFEALGERQPSTRHCTECGQALERGWKFCPGCGVEVFWD